MISPAVVDPDHVRSALQQLSRHQSPVRNPLADLACVRRAVRQSGFEATREAREFELGRLIEELVSAELERLRQQVGLTGAGAPRDLRRWPAAARIRQDFDMEHPELEAWSSLHHRYLRPDLSLTLQDLIDLLPARCRRTIQRRLQRGILALAERLAALERETRRQAQAEAPREAAPKPRRPEIPPWPGLAPQKLPALAEEEGLPPAAAQAMDSARR